MPVKTVEGVKIMDTGYKKWNFDYEQGDIKALYNRGSWRKWQDEIKWLEKNGERDNEFTPGETVAMVEDLRSLHEGKAPFESDPMNAYKLAHKYRSQNNRKFAREHREAVESSRRVR